MRVHRAKRDVIVMGGSAGGLETLLKILSSLPKSFPGSIFVVLHIPSDLPSHLPDIFRNVCSMRVVSPRDGDPIRSGTIYVAPRNQHLQLRRQAVHLSNGPRENRHRPSVDSLFRSAAKYFSTRVIAVVVSGLLMMAQAVW